MEEVKQLSDSQKEEIILTVRDHYFGNRIRISLKEAKQAAEFSMSEELKGVALPFLENLTQAEIEG